jgi:8-oxo-dGTP diphosphatase
MQKQLIVTCAIIKKENKFLITQRPENKHNGNRWEFPGGTVEFGEDPKSCLIREIKEELDIDIKVNRLLDIASHVYEDRHIFLIVYESEIVQGEIKKKDIKDFAWIKKEEFKKYDLTEIDKGFISFF